MASPRRRGARGLRTRIVLIVGGAAAVLGVLLLALAPSIDDLRDELRFRREVIDAADDDVAALLAAAIDQETGERGFLITGRPEFLVPYDEGRREASVRIAALFGISDSVPGMAAALDDVEAALESWQTAVELEIDQRRTTGEVPSARVAHGETRRLFDELRVEIAGVDAILDDRGRTIRQDIDDTLQRLVVTIWITYLALAAVCLVVWYLLGRWVTRPIDELVAAVERVGGGDFEHVIAVDGPSELQAVAAATDSMRVEIVDRLSDATRARQALDQRAPAVVALREELEPAIPDLPVGIDLAICFEPQLGVLAGDFADVLRLDDDRIAVVVADASGHGAPVVVRALRVKNLIGAALAGGMAPAEAFELIAPRVGGDGEGWFVSAFILVAAADGALRWAGAGHPGALLRTGDGEVVELSSTGPVLGPVRGPWGERSMTPTLPWLAVVVTDGFFEARNVEREFLGEEPLHRQLGAIDPGEPGAAVALITSLREEVTRFIGDGVPDDDLTVVAVQVTGRSRGTVDPRAADLGTDAPPAEPAEDPGP